MPNFIATLEVDLEIPDMTQAELVEYAKCNPADIIEWMTSANKARLTVAGETIQLGD